MDELQILTLADLTRVLGRMESKLDRALEDQLDYKGRIESLERNRWYAHGFSAGIGAAVSAAMTLFFGTHK